MGKNKLRKFAELHHLPHVIERPYSMLINDQFELKGKWKSLFFKNDNPIVLELGCGKGEYTVNLAHLFPEKNFIGMDIKGARMWSGAKDSLDAKMTNVAFIRTSIELITSFFAINEVDEIWITFPDPQMQKYTKRLTATPFMQRYRQILSSEGIIHLKTDSFFLYEYTMEMIRVNNLSLLTNLQDVYQSYNIDPVLGIKTYYEQQWIARGMTIKYLQFKINSVNSWCESSLEIKQDPYRSFNRENAQKL